MIQAAAIPLMGAVGDLAISTTTTSKTSASFCLLFDDRISFYPFPTSRL